MPERPNWATDLDAVREHSSTSDYMTANRVTGRGDGWGEAVGGEAVTEVLPDDLSEDLVMLTKNDWRAELLYRKYPDPHYKVIASRQVWTVHFKYFEWDGSFGDGHLFRRGGGGVHRKMTRAQIKRFVGMTDEGREDLRDALEARDQPCGGPFGDGRCELEDN